MFGGTYIIPLLEGSCLYFSTFSAIICLAPLEFSRFNPHYSCGKFKFVKKIIVHEADNSTDKRVQQVEIVFNFIGDLDLPAVNQPITVTKGFNEKIA